MLTNDIPTALKRAIISFNCSVQEKTYYQSDFDLKNMFFQCLLKELKTVPFERRAGYQYLDFRSITTFNIVKGNLLELGFTTTSRFNSFGAKLTDELNDTLSKMDLRELVEATEIQYQLLNQYESTINKINSFKI